MYVVFLHACIDIIYIYIWGSCEFIVLSKGLDFRTWFKPGSVTKWVLQNCIKRKKKWYRCRCCKWNAKIRIKFDAVIIDFHITKTDLNAKMVIIILIFILFCFLVGDLTAWPQSQIPIIEYSLCAQLTCTKSAFRVTAMRRWPLRISRRSTSLPDITPSYKTSRRNWSRKRYCTA